MAATTGVYDISAIRAKLRDKMGELAADNFPEAIAQRFPHILARLADLWGSAALDAKRRNADAAPVLRGDGKAPLPGRRPSRARSSAWSGAMWPCSTPAARCIW